MENAALLDKGDGRQRFAAAGPPHTIAILETEAGAMGRALDEFTRMVGELVAHPFERDAVMRTAIDVAIGADAGAHDQDLELLAVARDGEALAGAVGNLLDAAERNAHTPLMARIRFQASAGIGCTDRRELRTKAMSASFASALTSASVTGFFSGFTAATSTMPKRPLASLGSG